MTPNPPLPKLSVLVFRFAPIVWDGVNVTSTPDFSPGVMGVEAAEAILPSGVTILGKFGGGKLFVFTRPSIGTRSDVLLVDGDDFSDLSFLLESFLDSLNLKKSSSWFFSVRPERPSRFCTDVLDLDRLVNGFDRFRPNVAIEGAMLSVQVGVFYRCDKGVYPEGMRVLIDSRAARYKE